MYFCGAMNIKYEDIYAKCRDLSSVEGRRIVNAEGESLYDIVHLTEQDKPIVNTMADEAASVVQAAMRYAITDIVYDAEGGTITFVEGNVLNKKSNADKLMMEAISAYVMMRWLDDKSRERSDAYKLIYENMLAAYVRTAYSKQAPKLSDYED